MIAEQTKSRRTQRRFGLTLLWKELIENSLLVVWIELLMVAFYVVLMKFVFPDAGGPAVGINNAVLLLILTCFFSAALTSSSMVSQEIGTANLQFLSSLPISRKKIWWTKVTSALLIHLFSMVAAITIFVYFYQITANFSQVQGTTIVYTQSVGQASLSHLLSENWFVPILTLGVFSIGALTTTLLDRTVTAVFICVISSALVAAVAGSIQSVLNESHYCIVWAFLAASAFASLGASYRVFHDGETLKTSKRAAILLNIALWDILPIVGALIVGCLWILY
jgi:ABC-type transport system involved in multi-copper enzyme maturation permease subunit